MRKVLSALIVFGLVVAATPSNADGYYRHPPRYHGGGGNGGAIAGGLIAGMVIGSILTAPRYEEPRYRSYDEYDNGCYRVFRGRDYYGRRVYETVCE